ncbi:hypothetical protein KBF61_03135 [Candidatus Saccharibacteria bacterium]|nr:hypothetical protein [Candidatus Saccharibacteria bacterium]
MKEDISFIFAMITTKPYKFALLWTFSLWLFVYLTNITLFAEIFGNSALRPLDKIFFLIDSLKNIFINLGDPRALSLLVFSFIASVNLLLMLQTIKRKRTAKGSKFSSVGSVGAIIGSHCISCGGSFVAPLITTIAGSSAYLSSARIGAAIWISVLVNLIAIVLVGRTTIKLANQEKHILLRSTT